MLETRVRSLGWEDRLEKEMTTHSSTLAWKIPSYQAPLSMGSQKVREITKDKLESVSGDKRTPPVPKKGEHRWMTTMMLPWVAVETFAVYRAFPLISVPLKVHRKSCEAKVYTPIFQKGNEAQRASKTVWPLNVRIMLEISWHSLHPSFLSGPLCHGGIIVFISWRLTLWPRQPEDQTLVWCLRRGKHSDEGCDLVCSTSHRAAPIPLRFMHFINIEAATWKTSLTRSSMRKRELRSSNTYCTLLLLE